MINKEQIEDLMYKIKLPEFDPIDAGHLHAMAKLAYAKGVDDAADWQPFETMPHDVYLIVAIKSENNDEFERIAYAVMMKDGMWFGNSSPDRLYGEYVTHWRPMLKFPSGS